MVNKQPYQVLLIEPNLEIAKTLIAWMQEHAHVVHVIEAAEAKEKASLTTWDLVITDLNTSTANDLDITQIVKNVSPVTALLIVTEDKKVDFIITAMQNHADGLMFKPLDKEEFIKKIMQLMEDSRKKRLQGKKIILAIGAHPDDVEFGCAGTLAKHSAEGATLNILTLSSGEVGGNSSVRTHESEVAAKLQHAYLFMGNFTDTEITHTAKTIQFIEKIVHEVQPTHIYTHSFNDNHQDHRNTYHASITACRQIPNLYCYLSPSSTIDFRPNVFINIDAYIEKKIKVINAFSSQSTIRPYLNEDLIRATARYWGRFCNYHLAEPMEVIKEHS